MKWEWSGIWSLASPGVKAGKEGAGMMEEDEPRPPRARLIPLPLDLLGVDELRAYIAELQAEIARVEAEIGRKQGHRSAAEAFFRKG
jgi:uncharacterized small protein (DUF1192 family)